MHFTLGKARGAGRRVLCQLTAASRTLPDFLIIGAQKAGTTSLYDYLVHHPDVRRAGRKEVHFFDNAFGRGERWYRSFFPTERDRQAHRAATGRALITGEATPYYLFHPLVPGRVAATIPRARLIVLLRDPVARAYSHYMHEKVRGNEPLTFEAALAVESERLTGVEAIMSRSPLQRSAAHQTFAYFGRGLYAEQLRRWYTHFPREQILVLKAERLYLEPASVTSEVFRFLGLPDHEQAAFDVRNPGRYTEGLSPLTERRLRLAYRQPNQDLFDLTGITFDWDVAAHAGRFPIEHNT